MGSKKSWKIHSNLVLDHLYIGLVGDEFDEIEGLFPQLECINKETVHADTESWTGLYISTRGHNYFEFLRDRRPNKLGIAEKAYSPMGQNVGHIVDDFPNLPWRKSLRTIGGKPWFDAYACVDYLDQATPFNVWAMGYHQRDSGMLVKFHKHELRRMTSLKFTAQPSLKSAIEENVIWVNGKKDFSDNGVRLELQTYYADPVELEIEYCEQPGEFAFQSISFELHDVVAPQTTESKNFRLSIDSKLFTLSRR